jgi:hypothetical protein
MALPAQMEGGHHSTRPFKNTLQLHSGRFASRHAFQKLPAVAMLRAILMLEAAECVCLTEEMTFIF